MSELHQEWHVDRDDHVSILRYDGGERRTLGIAGAGALADLLAERAGRDEPPVVVLVLDVLHAELNEVLEMAAGRPIAEWAPWLAAISGLENYPSAIVAAVEVQATCGGLELALAADMRVASPVARLGVLETRIGLIPGAGGTQRLPGLVGMGNANLLVLSGESISGTEAHRMGLVQLLDDDPVAGAVALAERLASRGGEVLAAAKRAMRAARTTTDEGFREEGRGFLGVVGRPETVETMTAWVARQDAGTNPATDPSPLS